MILFLFLIFNLNTLCYCHPPSGLNLLFQWRSIDYEFPSQSVRNQMIKRGEFIPGNGVPIDVEYWKRGHVEKTFITIPKFKPGIPATLSQVSSVKNGDEHLLKPYPDWSWHKEGRCDGITSAFRTKVDACDRLWVIDSATLLYKSPPEKPCQPQVLAFNLENDQLAGRYEFPSGVALPNSVLATIVVDVRDAHEQCLDTFVYISDVTGFGIIVFDARKGRSWRIQHRSMYPSPSWGIYRTNGVEFDLMDGVLGLALNENQNGDRTLYYHAFSSITENWVPTSVIRNESLFRAGIAESAKNSFFMNEEARTSQAAPEVFDHQGVLYFNQIALNTLNCWNSRKPYTSENIHVLAKDDTNLQFVTGIKIWKKEDGLEDLYVFTTRFQLAMVNRMNPKEINFRILKADLKSLTKNSPCTTASKPQPNKPLIFPKRPYKSGYGNFGRPNRHFNKD